MDDNAHLQTKIALFNHKGGVSKTTTSFNLGWKLAELGHRVVMVDADPQCNLTGMVTGYAGLTDLENFYEGNGNGGTIYTGLTPAFEAQPRSIEAVPLIEVSGRSGLYLLAGDIRLAEYETTLGIAQELSGAIQTLKNIPGSLDFLIKKTAESVNADIVILDMSPGLGPINQNLTTISDYIIVPTAPDFFSVMAVDSLARVLPRWRAWAEQAEAMLLLQDAAYPFIVPQTKILGTVVQKYRPRAGQPAASFQNWIDQLGTAMRDRLIPALKEADLSLGDSVYERAGVSLSDLCLAQIPDFNSLIAKSQEMQTPVFALSNRQLGAVGSVLENWIESRDSFDRLFSTLAHRVVALVESSED